MTKRGHRPLEHTSKQARKRPRTNSSKGTITKPEQNAQRAMKRMPKITRNSCTPTDALQTGAMAKRDEGKSTTTNYGPTCSNIHGTEPLNQPPNYLLSTKQLNKQQQARGKTRPATHARGPNTPPHTCSGATPPVIAGQALRHAGHTPRQRAVSLKTPKTTMN